MSGIYFFEKFENDIVSTCFPLWQIRVDFHKFEINHPDAKGQCNTDFFLITGGSPVPTLCGLNDGQHGMIYSWEWCKKNCPKCFASESFIFYIE